MSILSRKVEASRGRFLIDNFAFSSAGGVFPVNDFYEQSL
jgi:hypothetical protein